MSKYSQVCYNRVVVELYLESMVDKTQEIKVKVVPYRKENTSRVYSNYVRVVSSPREITLQFCDVKPPENDDYAEKLKKNPVMKSPIEVEITLPIEVAQALKSVLKGQLEKVNSDLNGKKNK